MTDDDAPPANRKNSILIREDTSSRTSAVHPHFVESVVPHRSPSVSLENTTRSPPATARAPPPAANVANPVVSSNTTADTANVASAQTQQLLTQFHFDNRSPIKDSDMPSPNSERAGLFSEKPAAPPLSPVQPSPKPVQPQQLPPQQPPNPAGNHLQRALGGHSSIPSSGNNGSAHITPFGIPGAAHADAWLSRQLPSRTGSPLTAPEPDPPVGGRTTSKQLSDPRIPMNDGKIHILLGVTGSLYLSSVKQTIVKLQGIFGDRVAIQVIVTPVAEKMIAAASNAAAANAANSGNPATANAVNAANPGNATNPVNAASHINHTDPSANPTATAAGASNSATAGSSATGANCSTGVGNSTGTNPNSNHYQASDSIRIWHDADEWDCWHGRNDPVLHIELRRWADILLIAPLSANTLGKIAMGLCDNLLTNVVRAWNAQYPILIAPAMVTYAYIHPATKQHLKIIREEMKWIEILRPTEKVAGSTGGIGMGGMMPWNEIVAHVVQKLGGYPDDDDDEDDDEEAEEQRRRERSNAVPDDDEDEDENDDILQDNLAKE